MTSLLGRVGRSSHKKIAVIAVPPLLSPMVRSPRHVMTNPACEKSRASPWPEPSRWVTPFPPLLSLPFFPLKSEECFSVDPLDLLINPERRPETASASAHRRLRQSPPPRSAGPQGRDLSTPAPMCLMLAETQSRLRLRLQLAAPSYHCR